MLYSARIFEQNVESWAECLEFLLEGSDLVWERLLVCFWWGGATLGFGFLVAGIRESSRTFVHCVAALPRQKHNPVHTSHRVCGCVAGTRRAEAVGQPKHNSMEHVTCFEQ